MSAYNDLQAQLFDSFTHRGQGARHPPQGDRAARRRRSSEKQDQLAAEKKTIDTKLAEAEDAARPSSRPRSARRCSAAARSGCPSGVDASGRAAAAIRYAMAQVGKSYVYGAAGPNAFDCSGLTMMAWAQAGVALPHSSSAQYGSGPHVASSDLQPGDLVFYYSPISHVAMYIGNGLIVHAANPGAGVRVSGSTRCRTSAPSARLTRSAAPG